ncbi:MAG TPA: hypothetical protein VMV18_02715 [bacterium]|nr:hypothetical protein [bacterium]
MDLHAKVIGGFSILQLASMIGGVIVVGWLLKAVAGMLGGGAPPEDKFSQRVQCTNCGWVGTVPKFKGACRKCGNTSLNPA